MLLESNPKKTVLDSVPSNEIRISRHFTISVAQILPWTLVVPRGLLCEAMLLSCFYLLTNIIQ